MQLNHKCLLKLTLPLLQLKTQISQQEEDAIAISEKYYSETTVMMKKELQLPTESELLQAKLFAKRKVKIQRSVQKDMDPLKHTEAPIIMLLVVEPTSKQSISKETSATQISREPPKAAVAHQKPNLAKEPAPLLKLSLKALVDPHQKFAFVLEEIEETEDDCYLINNTTLILPLTRFQITLVILYYLTYW